jgi:simple sugar transport system ATP-binding protein
MPGKSPVLSVKGITKKFSGTTANDNVNLDLYAGEILALLGENGAGKTTLMNVIYGLLKPDSGEIWINGSRVEIGSPRDALSFQIGMVHQHFMLIPVMTVLENVVLGYETSAFGFLAMRETRGRIEELSGKFGFDLSVESKVGDLSVGQQQQVEIIKALFRGAKILILDEPTAVLTPHEKDELLKIMKSLAAEGCSIIFITHKLNEVMEVADRVVVLRGGAVAGEAGRGGDFSANKLARMIVGEEKLFEGVVDRDMRCNGKDRDRDRPVLTVERLTVKDDRGVTRVDDVSFDVYEGEILGIAGVQGNGQNELAGAVTGLRKAVSGKILLKGRDITGASPGKITGYGLASIPEDRRKTGMISSFTVMDNLILKSFDKRPFSKAGVLKPGSIKKNAHQMIEQYYIKASGPDAPASTLSGGNQQKMVLSREFSLNPEFLIVSQPTRGLDILSTEFAHRKLLEARDMGIGILLISYELDEIISLSDRVAVIFRGKIPRILEKNEVSKENISRLMTGVM